ncbi:MAG: hypothetical protein ACT4P7_19675 [Gemmatimonadaceae bacterium]
MRRESVGHVSRTQELNRSAGTAQLEPHHIGVFDVEQKACPDGVVTTTIPLFPEEPKARGMSGDFSRVGGGYGRR